MDPVIGEANASVMAPLIARQAEVARSVQHHLASDITELRGDPEIIEMLGASVAGNIDTIFHALRYDISLENIEAPTAALEYARRLAQRGVTGIDEIRVDLDPSQREHMVQATGRRTVPQIFIGDTHVGGCDDLVALDGRGELMPLLGAA